MTASGPEISFSESAISTISRVIWHPPIANWLKVNTDGAVTKNPPKAACGGIFRSSEGFSRGSFAQNLTTGSAIEISHNRNWNSIWLETDSMLLLLAFKNHLMLP